MYSSYSNGTSCLKHEITEMLAVENICKFGELILDSPNFSLSMFYKSVKLISHYPVDCPVVLLSSKFFLNLDGLLSERGNYS